MRETRLPELEALRGLAIVAVVGMHVSFGFVRVAPFDGAVAACALTLHLLTSFGTPLFVALSMAGLATGWSAVGDVRSYLRFLARRAGRILPGYVFWTIVTLVRDDPSSLGRPLALAYYLASGAAAYHLYFVPLIVQYYVAWPVLARLGTWARRSAATAAAIGVAGIVVMLAVWRAASAGLIGASPWTLPLLWIGYAVLGIVAAPLLARPHPDQQRRRATIVGCALASGVAAAWMIRHVRAVAGPSPDAATLAVASTIFQPPIMAYALAAMALATACVRGPSHGTRLLRVLGRSSYGVYLAHVLVLHAGLDRILGRPATLVDAPATAIAVMLGEWAVCLVLTWGLVRGVARVPSLAPLVGDRALTPPPPPP